MDIWMMDYLDRPEELISTIKTFTIDSAGLERLTAAGVNPLVELGIMPQSESSGGCPSWVYAILGILAVLAVGSMAYALAVRKR
ncbi:MAG: hypothetical protein SVP26_07485 [Chloroflexota bacterium]|nr:hypothetical protein [Chloroflexota bacterium]